ncbi:hypothetical protein NGY2020029_03270 [Vibrio cholerae]
MDSLFPTEGYSVVGYAYLPKWIVCHAHNMSRLKASLNASEFWIEKCELKQNKVIDSCISTTSIF